MNGPPANAQDAAGCSPVLERNIAALIARRRAQENKQTLEQRSVSLVFRFAASLPFVYIHIVFFAAWIVVNCGFTPLPAFDPSFSILAMIASVEAIFLSTFILIAQNRLSAEAERRAELDLHISLLAEHEITRLLTLMTSIAAKLGVDAAQDPSIESLKEDVAPEQVLDRIDAAHDKDDTAQK
jgi:uncharacterized membrane protein